MALVKSYKEIESLIPDIYDKCFIRSCYGSVSEEERNKKKIFAFFLDEKEGKVCKIFIASFVVYKGTSLSYLLITDTEVPINSTTPSVNINPRIAIKKNDNIWGFKTNEIGLYLKTTSYDKSTIYFGTEYTDVKVLREKFEKSKVVVAETVFA